MFEISGVIIALFGMVLFGVGDSLFEIPARKYKEKVILLYQFSFTAFLSLIIIFIKKGELYFIHDIGWSILLPVLSGVFDILALFFLIKSIKKSSVGLSISIASAYPFVVAIYSLLFLAEKLNFLQNISIVFIIIGIFILSMQSLKIRNLKFDRNLKFAFLSLVFWSADFVLLKYSANYYNEIESTVLNGLGAFLFVSLFVGLTTKIATIRNFNRESIVISFLISSLFFAGIFSISAALERIGVGIVSAIISSSAVLTTLIGYFFYKERFEVHQYFGIGVVITSLFLLSFFA